MAQKYGSIRIQHEGSNLFLIHSYTAYLFLLIEFQMRKHLRNKRLESLSQLGVDRIVDLQFGTGEAAYHVILELYDRGNLILTDHELRILYILRPHTEGESVRFFVKEIYPQNRGRESKAVMREDLENILIQSKVGDQLKKTLVSKLGQ